MQIALAREGFDLYKLNRKVFHHAVKDTKYETLEDVVDLSTNMIMCAEPKVSFVLFKQGIINMNRNGNSANFFSHV